MGKLALTLPGGFNPQGQGVPSGGMSMLETILRNTLILVFIVAVILAVIFLILGGIRWITSGGDAKGIEAARKQITYAIIGLIVTLVAFAIIVIIGQIFQTQLLGF